MTRYEKYLKEEILSETKQKQEIKHRSMLAQLYNFWEKILSEYIKTEDWIIEELIRPKNIFELNKIRVTMDDGSIVYHRAWLITHTHFLRSEEEIYKGGIFFAYDADRWLTELKSAKMEPKTGLTCGFFGGGGKLGLELKEGHSYSYNERVRTMKSLCKDFARRYAFHKKFYCAGPDSGTNDLIEAFVQEFSLSPVANEIDVKEIITGKPLESGGAPGREDATSRGAMMAYKKFRELASDEMKKIGLPEKPTWHVQGSGNVGLNVAKRLLVEDLGPMDAISDVRGGIYRQNGLNIAKVIAYYEKNGTYDGFPKSEADPITNDELLQLKDGILDLCATQGVITTENAHLVKSKLVRKIANEPVETDAHFILLENGIPEMSDSHASMGGIILSGIEMRQGKTIPKALWKKTAEENYSLLNIMIDAATNDIFEAIEKYQLREEAKRKKTPVDYELGTQLAAFEYITKNLRKKHGHKHKSIFERVLE